MSDTQQLTLKSEHLWPMVEDFTKAGRWQEHDDDAPNDFNTPDFVVRAMLDDLKAMQAALAAKEQRIANYGVDVTILKQEIEMYQDDLAECNQRIAELEAQLAEARRWEPVPDGEYTPHPDYTLHIYHNGQELEAWAGDIDHNDINEISVGDYRLCRLAAPQGANDGA